MLNQMATTKTTEIRFQNIQWIVSNEARLDSGIRISILVVFSVKSMRIAVIAALILVLGFIFDVDRISMRRR